LNWPAATGRIYQVQYKDDIADPVWLNLSGNLTVTAGQASFIVSKSAATRYYRVIGSF